MNCRHAPKVSRALASTSPVRQAAALGWACAFDTSASPFHLFVLDDDAPAGWVPVASQGAATLAAS
eukprot:119917-Pyramimonas_sp.AAC.1